MKELILSRGMVTIVDDEDYEKFSKFKWTYLSSGYAYRFERSRKEGKCVLLHREILEAKKGYEVDHINRDKLDNRKCNLRVCTSSQNKFNIGLKSNNTSGYKGVYSCKNGRWKAQAKINGVDTHLGIFNSKEKAAEAWNRAAKEHYGEFAVLNKINT